MEGYNIQKKLNVDLLSSRSLITFHDGWPQYVFIEIYVKGHNEGDGNSSVTATIDDMTMWQLNKSPPEPDGVDDLQSGLQQMWRKAAELAGSAHSIYVHHKKPEDRTPNMHTAIDYITRAIRSSGEANGLPITAINLKNDEYFIPRPGDPGCLRVELCLGKNPCDPRPCLATSQECRKTFAMNGIVMKPEKHRDSCTRYNH